MTKSKFLIFEEIRLSKLANMYNIDSVRTAYAKFGVLLTVEECLDIMFNYKKYKQKYDKR